MNDNGSIITLLRKIESLARLGATDGERFAAQYALTAKLKKHGLSLEDILDSKRTIHWFKHRGMAEAQIIRQALSVSIGYCAEQAWGRKDKKSELGYELTAAEGIDANAFIPSLLKAYRKAIKDINRDLLEAFIFKNRLSLRDDAERDDGEEKYERQFSDEQIARIVALMSAIPQVSTPARRLENKTDENPLAKNP